MPVWGRMNGIGRSCPALREIVIARAAQAAGIDRVAPIWTSDVRHNGGGCGQITENTEAFFDPVASEWGCPSATPSSASHYREYLLPVRRTTLLSNRCRGGCSVHVDGPLAEVI